MCVGGGGALYDQPAPYMGPDRSSHWAPLRPGAHPEHEPSPVGPVEHVPNCMHVCVHSRSHSLPNLPAWHPMQTPLSQTPCNWQVGEHSLAGRDAFVHAPLPDSPSSQTSSGPQWHCPMHDGPYQPLAQALQVGPVNWLGHAHAPDPALPSEQMPPFAHWHGKHDGPKKLVTQLWHRGPGPKLSGARAGWPLRPVRATHL